MILVPERSLGSRDTNVGKPIVLQRPETHGWGAEEKGVIRTTVCPWCLNPSQKKASTNNMVTCKECGTAFHPEITYSIVPEESMGLKDRNMDRHTD
jgi:hypothetical protein